MWFMLFSARCSIFSPCFPQHKYIFKCNIQHVDHVPQIAEGETQHLPFNNLSLGILILLVWQSHIVTLL